MNLKIEFIANTASGSLPLTCTSHTNLKQISNLYFILCGLDICGLGIRRHPHAVLCAHQYLRHSSSKYKEDVEHQRMPSGVNTRTQESWASKPDLLNKI